MSVFPKTRAAAGYAARHVRSELARTHATILLARLDACEGVLPGGDGDVQLFRDPRGGLGARGGGRRTCWQCGQHAARAGRPGPGPEVRGDS